MATSRSWRDAAAGLLEDLRAVFGPRLLALVVYEAHGLLGDAPGGASDHGPDDIRHADHVHTLAVVDALSCDDLSRLAPLAPKWGRQRLAVPLILPSAELPRSLDAFPLEFSQMIAHHVVVAGDDPFRDMAVAPDDLRRACETQVRSHLLHLREGFLQAGGNARKLTELVTASATPLKALLVNLARLHGVNARSSDALAHFASGRLGLPLDGITPLLAATPADHIKAATVTALFPAHLGAVEHLARLVDEWTR